VDSNIDFYNQEAILGMGGIAFRWNWILKIRVSGRKLTAGHRIFISTICNWFS